VVKVFRDPVGRLAGSNLAKISARRCMVGAGIAAVAINEAGRDGTDNMVPFIVFGSTLRCFRGLNKTIAYPS
jgi:hypothetical protein